MSSTPYARLLLSIDGGAATAGGVEAAAEASVQLVYESTAGWPATPPPYAEVFEAPPGWEPDPIVGWVETDGPVWRYYGSTPPPAFAAPSLALWGKVKMQLVVGGGRKAGALSADMTSEATLLVRSAEGLESVAHRETTEFDAIRAWIGAIQRDLRLVSTALGAVSALTEAQLRAVSATLTAALPVNGKKITGLADGTTSTDAAAFGQIAAALTARTLNTTAPITGGGNLSADRTLAFAPSADVAMGGYGFTGCPSMANAAGDITCTPKSTHDLVSRKDGLTTTYASSITARNATAATNVATVQNGPVVCSEGSGWRTSAGGAAITVRGGIMAVPVSGSTVAARVYTVYDVGAGYSLGDYCTNSDPYLFGSARVVDTVVLGAGGSGIRWADAGQPGLRRDSNNVQLTSGGTNDAGIATNGTWRHRVSGSTSDVTQTLDSTASILQDWGTAGDNRTIEAKRATTTTGNTTTNVFTYSMLDNREIWVEAWAYCYIIADPTKRAWFAKRAMFNRNGGAPATDISEDIRADFNTGGWGSPPTFAITAGAPTTNDWSLQVTGLVGTDIRWVVTKIEIHVITTSA